MSRELHKVHLVPEEASDDPSSRKLVMVIDDSNTVRQIVKICLSREGYAVKGFSDGIEAMKWLSEPGSPTPALVILDIGLPKIDGYEVARRLKATSQFTHTVIVMLSRRDGMIDRLKGRLAGARNYLTKPLKTNELLSVVKSHLGELYGQRDPD